MGCGFSLSMACRSGVKILQASANSSLLQNDGDDKVCSLINTLSEELNQIWPADSEKLTLRFPLMGRWGLLP